MKLYYSPGACSLAAHIVLREAGIEFQPVEVNLGTKKTVNGDDFLAINPKGYVPALEFEDGQVLTEDHVIIQYLADQKPALGLAPAFGTMARYRLMEWLGFIATEVHKGFGPLWNSTTPETTRQNAVAQLSRRFEYLAGKLAGGPWLMGEAYTVADAYLFTVLRWSDVHHIDLSRWPRLIEYMGRVTQRSAVQEALRAEHLID